MSKAASRGKYLALGVLSGWVNTLVSAASSLVLTTLAVKFLSPDVAGIWFVLLSAGWISMILDLGVGVTLGREIAYAAERGDTVRMTVLRKTSQVYFLVLAALVSVLGALVALQFLSGLAGSAEGIWLAVILFIFGCSIIVESLGAQAVLVGSGEYAYERSFRSIGIIANLALAVALVPTLGIVALSAAFVLQAVTTRILCGWRLRKYHVERGVTWSFSVARSLVVPSISAGLTSIGGFLILGTDNFVIATTLGVSHVPQYAVVARLVSFASAFPLVIISSIVPRVARLHAAGDMEGVREALLRVTTWAVILMLAEVAFLIIWFDSIFMLWVGSGNYAGLAVFIPLVVAFVFEVHHVAHAAILSATGRVPFAAWAIGAGILNLCFSVVLARYFGLAGVALGTLLAQLLTNNWYVPWRTMKEIGVGRADYIERVLIPVATVATLLALGSFLSKVLTQQLLDGWWQLITGLMLYGIWMIASILIGIPDARFLVVSLWRRLR